MRMLGAVALSSEFTDPRLVAVYDALNAYGSGTQPEFYLGLAREADATTVVELGCGTGLVAVEFARDGFDVIALEPSEQMLEVARGRCRGDNVRWIPGGVSAHDIRGVDMVFMAGHVAQFFLADDEWREVILSCGFVLLKSSHRCAQAASPSSVVTAVGTASRSRVTTRR